MVSIKDIAKICGVSTATVSKALNDHADIGKATKERVCKAAEELGYIANPSARAIKTNRTKNIGILFDDAMGSGLSHEYFSLILESFRAEAETRGYDITFISQTAIHGKANYLRHCQSRAFDGVIIISADYENSDVRQLAQSEIPVVTLDYMYEGCSSVMSDNYNGMQRLMNYIVSGGHRSIAYIHGEETAVTRDRVSAFHRVCRENGIRIPEAYFRSGRYHDIAGCAALTEELLSLDNRPTCLLCPDDYSLLGAMETIKRAGLSIPKDISVAGYDGIHMARVMKITSYAQDTLKIGKKSAEKLINRIENKEADIEHIEIMGTLLEGETVGFIS